MSFLLLACMSSAIIFCHLTRRIRVYSSYILYTPLLFQRQIQRNENETRFIDHYLNGRFLYILKPQYTYTYCITATSLPPNRILYQSQYTNNTSRQICYNSRRKPLTIWLIDRWSTRASWVNHQVKCTLNNPCRHSILRASNKICYNSWRRPLVIWLIDRRSTKVFWGRREWKFVAMGEYLTEYLLSGYCIRSMLPLGVNRSSRKRIVATLAD